MGYRIAFTDKASGQLDRMPARLAWEVTVALEQLAQDPVAESEPIHFPFRPPGQLFKQWIEVDGVRWHLTCAFVYGSDEGSINIL